MTAPMPGDVAAAFAAFPGAVRDRLEEVRALIFYLAETTGTGPLTEALKWGQPAYLTAATKAGSTIRLGVDAERPAVFFTCSTTLVDGFRADFPDTFAYSGNRALLLGPGDDRAALEHCLIRALTYHRRRA